MQILKLKENQNFIIFLNQIFTINASNVLLPAKPEK